MEYRWKCNHSIGVWGRGRINRFLVGETNWFILIWKAKELQVNWPIRRFWKNQCRSRTLLELVEIGGTRWRQPNDNEAHIVFSSFENRFYGSTGCNSSFGQYQLTDGQSIAFSQAGSTRMMCAEMSVEDQLLPLLDKQFSMCWMKISFGWKIATGNLLANGAAKMKWRHLIKGLRSAFVFRSNALLLFLKMAALHWNRSVPSCHNRSFQNLSRRVQKCTGRKTKTISEQPTFLEVGYFVCGI